MIVAFAYYYIYRLHKFGGCVCVAVIIALMMRNMLSASLILSSSYLFSHLIQFKCFNRKTYKDRIYNIKYYVSINNHIISAMCNVWVYRKLTWTKPLMT